ncbi:YdaS family helix-turn-helix protein [Agrobacterium pusense]|uniref:YdaS family helix-turn-helix protein n=1 Tax=Agrobacterium pusense TaxID=648995 RepID=UPI0018E59FB0
MGRMKVELSSPVHLSIACIDFKAVLLIPTMKQNPNSVGLEVVKRSAGGASAVSRIVGVTPQAVAQWKAVPPEYVLRLEKAFGVSRHVQRPDVFGAEAVEAAE